MNDLAKAIYNFTKRQKITSPAELCLVDQGLKEAIVFLHNVTSLHPVGGDDPEPIEWSISISSLLEKSVD